MTRYHFHAADGSQYRDEEGEELPSLQAAKKVALDLLIQLLPAKADEFWDDKAFSVSVKDETGRLVAMISTTAIVDPEPIPEIPPET